MKRIISLILSLISVMMLFTSCTSNNAPKNKTNFPSDSIVNSNELFNKRIINISSLNFNVSDEKINCIYNFLFNKFGKTDKETGFQYIFEIARQTTINDKVYYIGRWRWMVKDENGRPDHSSLLTEFIINNEMTEMYEVSGEDSDTFEWTENNNLLK